jgi:hypothetical protein
MGWLVAVLSHDWAGGRNRSGIAPSHMMVQVQAQSGLSESGMIFSSGATGGQPILHFRVLEKYYNLLFCNC